MAVLTDEQKANAILEGVDDFDQDETQTGDQDTGTDDTNQLGDDEVVEDDDDQQDKPEDAVDDTTDTSDRTLTKQFPNLKGEDWESYGASLESAYDNSFKEGLRLYEENKSLKTENAQLRGQMQQPVQQPVQPGQPGAPAPQQGNEPQPPVPAPVAQAPEWAERAIQRDRQDMVNAFDPFKKEYPQVLDTPNFEAFRNASDGVKATMTQTMGRVPTWPELFNGIAGLLGWQPATPQNRKNAAIKDAATSTRGATGGQSRPAPKKEKFSDEQIAAYQRMFPNLSREQAIEQLSEDN